MSHSYAVALAFALPGLILLTCLPDNALAQLGCKLTFEDGTTQSFEHGESFGPALPTVCGPNFPCYCENGQANCPLCTTQNVDGNYVCAKDGDIAIVLDTDNVLKDCTCDFVFGTQFFWKCSVADLDATATPVETVSAAPTAVPVSSGNATMTERPVSAAPNTTVTTDAPTADEMVLDDPTFAPVASTPVPAAPQCRIQMGTSDCDSLLQTTQEECDCYNFCTGEFMGCCDYGGDCSLECKGNIVAGCTRKGGDGGAAPVPVPSAPSPPTAPIAATPPPTVEITADRPPPTVPAPTAPPPQCSIQIGASNETCDALVQTVATDANCQCYSFCNGEFEGCCDYDGPCSLSCVGTIVAGCTGEGGGVADAEGTGGGGTGGGSSPPPPSGAPPSELPPSGGNAACVKLFLKAFVVFAAVGFGGMLL